MKKFLLILLVVVLTICTFTACTNDEPKPELKVNLEDYKFEFDGKVVEEDFSLPKEVLGHQAEWTSNSAVIEIEKDDDGITADVNRPEIAGENISVNLTLSVLGKSKNYTVFVKPVEIGDADHTIIFYSTQGSALSQVTDVIIKNFEEKYPGWKVKHVQVGEYDDLNDRVLDDLENGYQPDIAYCIPDNLAQYLYSGKVIDLNQFVNSKDTEVGYSANEINDFVGGFYNEGLATNYADYAKYGYTSNSLLSLPFLKATEVMYYNKTALDSLGLTPAKTWDELWSQCENLQTRYPKCIPFGTDNESNWFITMCRQNGWGYTSATAPHFQFNNADTKAWLTQLREYYEKGYFATRQDNGGMYLTPYFTRGVDDGGLVYYIGSSNGASHNYPSSNSFECGIAPIPDSQNGAICQGPSLVMFESGNSATNSEEKARMTFLFMKELLKPEVQATYAMLSNYNPVRLSTYNLSEYVEFLTSGSINAVAQLISITMLDGMFTTPGFIGSTDAREEVGEALISAIQGKKTAEKALSDALSECETDD